MSVEHAEEITGDGEGEQTATVAVTAAAVTAAVRYYSVAPGVRVNVRSGPSTSYGIVRVLSEGARVPIYCQTPGQTISGPYGTTNLWDNIDNGQYISDAYVYTGSDGYVAGRCG
ncbi:SH3 domain-containing protein [Streptomyces sp. 11x1]|uniref:SH3 domain-containing protein n=1 Tax=Streptomyces sp. 11x1 TaxID=3038642 RepID=UPI002930271D|nr:SH3 domain-containing protein [Streptomyces sp. 11x1]WNZ09466.1 SH3 domain-containing protein [Streptomyces sp. 11x1]